jgi:hypothetical protein
MHPSSCILLLNGETLSNLNVIVYTSLKKEINQMGFLGSVRHLFQTSHYGCKITPSQQKLENFILYSSQNCL